MASILLSLLLLTFLTLVSLVFASESQPIQSTFKPNTLVVPVHKDNATNLHVAYFKKRTPLVSVPLLVDLNGRFLWVNCEQNYLSSTYNAPFCRSTQCSRAGFHFCNKCSSTVRPGCHNNTCGVTISNPFTHRSAIGELAQDFLSIQSAQGSGPGPVATVPRFLFACAPSVLFQGPLPKDVQGFAGLGHTPVALPTQLASHFGFQPQFALCLTSSTNKNGVIFFGHGPYKFLPGIDITTQLTNYTPLSIGSQGEYFLFVKSIRINEKPVQFNTSLLLRNKKGSGGTMISTNTPYTILEHSIFQAFTQFFANQLSTVPQVAAVSPFGVCFNSDSFTNTRVGPEVPNIDFVFQNHDVSWRIFGANSMVQARPGVLCLAFVNGGQNPRTSIVIGTHQLEDNLLHFDLARSRVGFSSSLLFKSTACANFNFTSAP